MKFNLKTYKLLKFKTYVKQKKFLILTLAVTKKNQIKQDQKFKTLNYNYYQIYNTLSKKVLKNSIYANYFFLIKSAITLLSIKTKKKPLDLEELTKNVTVIGFKINNKIYLAHMLKRDDLRFIFKLNHMNTVKTLKTILTSFKSSK